MLVHVKLSLFSSLIDLMAGNAACAFGWQISDFSEQAAVL